MLVIFQKEIWVNVNFFKPIDTKILPYFSSFLYKQPWLKLTFPEWETILSFHAKVSWTLYVSATHKCSVHRQSEDTSDETS